MLKKEKILRGKGFDPRKLLKPGADAIMETVKREDGVNSDLSEKPEKNFFKKALAVLKAS